MIAMPELFLICGQNGAGKSTFNKKVCLRNSMEVIDTDEVAKVKNITNFSAGKLVGKMIRKNLSEQKTFAYESTLTANFDFRIVEMARENDYKINFVYIGLDSENRSRKRVDERVRRGGHDIPSDDIARRYQRSLNNLRGMIPKVDGATIYCNSFGNYNEIVRFSQKKIVEIVKNVPDWFQNIYSDVAEKYMKHRSDLESKKCCNNKPECQDKMIGLRMRATGHSLVDIQMAIALKSPAFSIEHFSKCVEDVFGETGDEFLQSQKTKELLPEWQKIESKDCKVEIEKQPKKKRRLKM